LEWSVAAVFNFILISMLFGALHCKQIETSLNGVVVHTNCNPQIVRRNHADSVCSSKQKNGYATRYDVDLRFLPIINIGC